MGIPKKGWSISWKLPNKKWMLTGCSPMTQETTKWLLQHEAELGDEAGEGEGTEGVDAVHVLQDALLLFLCKAWRPWTTALAILFVKQVSIECSKWNHEIMRNNEKQAARVVELELWQTSAPIKSLTSSSSSSSINKLTKSKFRDLRWS